MAETHAALHGARVLWWTALFELVAHVGLTAGAGLAGQAGWLLVAAAASGGFGAALGAVLDRPLRHRPAVVCGAVAATTGLLGWAVDGELAVAAFATVGAALAWARWRFPGQPSRGRTAFRALFAVALAAGLLLLGGRPVAPPRWAVGAVPRAPSALVVVLDTVRRDRLSTYGYARETSPRLSELAARGAAYAGWANACWSLPGHATVLTGRYAGAHGAHYESGAMNPGERTLARALGERGWDTVAVTGNPWVHVGNGLGDDFGALYAAWSADLFPDAFVLLRGARRLLGANGDKGGAWGAAAFASWLDARPDPERPFFALVNVFEAHAPYHRVHPDDAGRFTTLAPAAARRLSQGLLRHHLFGLGVPEDAAHAGDLYDGAVRGADRVLGMYLDLLRERGLERDTVVLVTSDHGEYLGEHGLWGHVHGLYEPVLQVPFVIAGPGVTAGARPDVARLVDVAPTVLDLLGEGALPDAQGRSVRAGGEVPVVAEQFVPVLLAGQEGAERHAGDLGALAVRRRSLLREGRKLHVTQGGAAALYALPDESRPLSDAVALQAEAEALDAWAAEQGITWPEAVGAGARASGFTREALEALGYVQ